MESSNKRYFFAFLRKNRIHPSFQREGQMPATSCISGMPGQFFVSKKAWVGVLSPTFMAKNRFWLKDAKQPSAKMECPPLWFIFCYFQLVTPKQFSIYSFLLLSQLPLRSFHFLPWETFFSLPFHSHLPHCNLSELRCKSEYRFLALSESAFF